MSEYLLSIVSFENIHSQSQNVLIISIAFIAVIILFAFIGQKTRVILPMTHSIKKYQHKAENDLNTVKIKNGFGLFRPETIVAKPGTDYRETLPSLRTVGFRK